MEEKGNDSPLLLCTLGEGEEGVGELKREYGGRGVE